MKYVPLASSSAGNAYLLESEGELLLIDAGLPFPELQEALNHRVSRLSAAIITHAHGDHALSAHVLADRGVPVYCHADTAAALSLTPYGLLAHHRTVMARGWKVMAVPVTHDVPNVALLIGRNNQAVFHVTDAGNLPVKVDPDILAVEVNYDEDSLRERVSNGSLELFVAKRIARNHLSIQKVLRWMRQQEFTRLREVHLLHLSAATSREGEFISAIERTVGVPVYAAPI